MKHSHMVPDYKINQRHTSKIYPKFTSGRTKIILDRHTSNEACIKSIAHTTIIIIATLHCGVNTQVLFTQGSIRISSHQFPAVKAFLLKFSIQTFLHITYLMEVPLCGSTATCD